MVRNTLIIFMVSGFWHGANWTFIVWGLLNALYILPSVFFNYNRSNLEIVAKGNMLPSLKEFVSILITFLLTVFAWIFFRSDNINGAFCFINEIFSRSFFSNPFICLYGLKRSFVIAPLLVFFMLIEWLGREGEFGLQNIGKNRTKIVRWSFYSFILFLIGMYMHTEETSFIYFQF
jgi:alginate O-acetyltransferase complex protein AlgI